MQNKKILSLIFLLGTFLVSVTAQITGPGASSTVNTAYTNGTPNDFIFIFCTPNAVGAPVTGALSAVGAGGCGGPYTFTWEIYNTGTNSFNPFTVQNGASSNLTGLASGGYALTVTDNCGAIVICDVAWVFVNQTIVDAGPAVSNCVGNVNLIGTTNPVANFVYYNPPPPSFIIGPATTITVCFNATHTFVSDLGFYLVGPPSCGSPTIPLSPNPGSIGQGAICNSGNNVNNLCFTTAAAPNLNVCTAGTPLTGTYDSYGLAPGTLINWAPLYGCDAAAGGWQVQIYDCIGADVGSLTNTTITFTGNAGCGANSISYNSGAIASAINDNSCTPGSASIFTVPTNPAFTTPITLNNTITSFLWTSNNGTVIPLSNSTLTPSIPNPGVDTWFYLQATDNFGCTFVRDSAFYDNTCVCTMTAINANIGACNPVTGTYSVNGTVSYTNPPAGGQLIITGCSGIQQVFNPPFGTSVNYLLTGLPANGAPCNVTATFTATPACTINVGGFIAPTCPCVINNFTANIGACNPATNTYQVTGQVQFTSAPAGGQMIVENCDGVQQVFNPPFVSPLNYTLSTCVPNGTACDVQVYFTAIPACQQTINFVEPTPCNCTADAGTFSANIVGTSTNNYVLCWGDQININSNNDFTYPGNVLDPVIPYNPGIFYMLYSCPPTLGIDIVTDPCFIGVIGPGQNYNDLNDLTVVNSQPPGTFVNNTVYYVPITMYDIVGYYYSVTNYAGTCFDLGTPFAVTYLPAITYVSAENCNTGQATFTITGGHPAVFGTNFTASGLTPATASFANTTCANGGTITINGLQNGDMYSFTITDANGCPITCNGGPYVEVSDATITPAGPFCPGDPAIQLTAVDPGGTWSATCGLCITAGGVFNPGIAGAGAYTITYTIPGVCGDVSNTNITVNPLLNSTINAQPPVCIDAAAVIFNAATPGGTWSATCGACINAVTGSFAPAIAGAGVHIITYTLAGSCGTVDTENMTVNALPNAVANNNGPLCELQNLNLTSGGGIDYDWTGPNAFAQNNTQNTTIIAVTLPAAGTYTVTVTDANGCVATATTPVVINTNLVFAAYNNGPICSGTQLDISADNIPTATYDWAGPNAYAQLNTQNPSIPGVTVLATGIYTVTATNSSGCTGTATTNVVVNALPLPVANSNSPVCSGTSLNLTSNGGTDYDWVGPNAYVMNNTQNPSINPASVLETGTYTVTVTDLNNCSATATVVAVVNALPIPIIGNGGPVCDGTNVGLTSGGGTNYAWTGPGGYNNATQNPIIIAATPAQTGVYTVTVTNANNCTSTATTALAVNPLPVVIANTNAPLCDGEDVTVSANGAVNYAWTGPNGFNVNAQNPVINNITAINNGIYTVTGTDANNCSSTATVNVTSFLLPTASLSGDNLFGCAPLCVNFTDQSNGNGGVINQWNWVIQGQNPINTQNAAVCFSNAGTYDAALTVITSDGCIGTLNLANYITVYPNPVAEFIYAPQEIIETEPEVTFASTSSNAVSWLWDFGDGATDVVENPLHSYGDTGTFCITLIVATNFGCTDTANGCLNVKPDYNLFIPNSFTVNDDGLNEIWQVYGRGIKTIVVRIFDRWGEEIYSFDNINKGWPGTKQNGQECKQDVYVYRVEVMDGKGDPHTYSGNVNLIR